MNRQQRFFLFFWLIISLGSCGDPDLPQDVEMALAKVPDQLDYNLHVKPILSDRCFACHGPDKNKQKGDLRLDLPVAYEKVSEETGRKALVPGKLAKSEVFHRIISTDPEVIMPTPESHLTLTAQEKAVLIKWIQDGAKYKPHWSLVAPKKTIVPVVKNKSWVRNPIDNFVLARLEADSLKPNAEASKETLIRRLSFDLTGLPPTIGEIDAFLADKSPEAYERVVNRLLSSPHYGERMANDWLDVARYADTHGYQDDGYRNSYPWRDWVIAAFNKNQPYNNFVTWQLAGDLLPNPNKEQIIATSFLRNHPQSQEGGIVDEEYRVEYVADRVNTFGKAFLAQSTECARCHDHKYDPISQKNYFQLYAFFNNNNETGEIPYGTEASPSLILSTPEIDKILKFLQEKKAPLEQQGKKWEDYQPGFKVWFAKAARQSTNFIMPKKGLVGYISFDEKLPVVKPPKPKKEAKSKKEGKPGADKKLAKEKPKKETKKNRPTHLTAELSSLVDGKFPVQVPGKFGQAVRVDGDMGIVFNEALDFDRHEPSTVSMWVKTLKTDESGPLFGKTGGDLNGWRGYYVELNKDQTLSIRMMHVYPANGIDLKTTQKLPAQQWQHLALAYDGSSKAQGIKLYLNGKEVPMQVINDNLQQSILFGKDKARMRLVRPFTLGREVRASITNVAFDEFYAYSRQLSLLEIKQLAGEKNLLPQLLKKPIAQLNPAQKNLLFEYYVRAVDKKYAAIQKKIIEVRGIENDTITNLEEVMVYKELPNPRPSFLLDRGVYDAPKERVFPNTPEKIMPFSKELPQNRLGLAQWLTSPKQPLFARVAVNRFWQQCFGKGIVKTADDFGNQGELPTHPELLDWLSVTFRESNWNVKKLMKTMVMSATYRQSSVPTTINKQKDPDNKLFSRAPSYRMSAEMIRDNALAASGLLVRKIGGKSVHPYQPEGVWEALAVRNDIKYEQGKGEDLYRRSMYSIWKRSSPLPAMITFDVPDRYACSMRRQKTSTPLQALVLMNDVQYVEASRVLAEKMICESGNTPEQRITYAFRTLTSRYPRKEELAILINLYQEENTDFKKHPERAKELLQEGAYGRDKKLPVTEVATCAIIANTLMNFDEFIIKR